MSAPDVYAVCLYGYSPFGDIVVTVQDPAGNVVESRTLQPEELALFNGFPFRRLGSDPKGVYTFTAFQGGMVASTTLEVRAAQTPQYIGYIEDHEGLPDFGFVMVMQPGATVRLALGGFSPNSTVQMRIYGNPHGTALGITVVDYLTSYPVNVNSAGVGMLELQTGSSDPEGCYVFFNELVTLPMYPSPGAPPIRWAVEFCLFANA